MAKPDAVWSINRAAFGGRVDDDGNAIASIPLRDRDELVGTLHMTMTPERNLTVVWEAEPGAESPIGFQAWSKVRGDGA